MPHELEAPGTDAAPEWASLYRARGDEVVAHRPLFTGDVFVGVSLVGESSPKNVIILQHPCAIRAGVALLPKLLVAEVNPSGKLHPSQWAGGSYKQLPLAELQQGGKPADFAAFFIKHHLVTPAELDAADRVACLSQRGVNLLMQRWVNHNSRVVVPTQMYQEVSAPQFEEADMMEDWCTDREDDGITVEAATVEIDNWLSWEDANGVLRRDRLKDEQDRSGLRRELRGHLKALRAGTDASGTP